MKNLLFPVAQLADDLRCLTKRKTFILIRINYPEDASGVSVTATTKVNINTVTIIVRRKKRSLDMRATKNIKIIIA